MEGWGAGWTLLEGSDGRQLDRIEGMVGTILAVGKKIKGRNGNARSSEKRNQAHSVSNIPQCCLSKQGKDKKFTACFTTRTWYDE